MSGHTPWHVEPAPFTFVSVYSVVDANGERVVDRYLSADLARLIAAAPDLLAALKAVEFGAYGYRRCPACAGWSVGPNGETDHSHTTDCPVALALAKAEGR